MYLSEKQSLLLHWLEQADSSALGECNGPVLSSLLDQGLATIEADPRPGYELFGRVRLTDAGRAALIWAKPELP